MVIIPNSYQIFTALLPCQALGFTLNSSPGQQASSHQNKQIGSFHQSYIPLFPLLQVFVTAQLR